MDVEDRRMSSEEGVYSDAQSPTSPATVLSERIDNDVLRSGNVSPMEDGKGMYSCDKCQYKAKQRSNLMRHYYTMHADLADSLECCGQLYRTKGDFRQHVKTVHKQGYLCKICNRTFSRKALLKRHSYVHNGIREFKCEHCNYATSHKSNLERHFKVHTPLLRKRRCRLSYRIANSYPKHFIVDARQVQPEPPTLDDKGCPNFLGVNLSPVPCPTYGMGHLHGSGNPWSKFPIPVDETVHRGPLPPRSAMAEYESLLKLQLMSHKQIDVRRTPPFPSEDVVRLHNLSSSTQKHNSMLRHVTPSYDSLHARLTHKEPSVFSPCAPNCLCAPKAMWMLPLYQGVLSPHELYAQLSNKSPNRSHPPTRREHVQRSHIEAPSTHLNAESAFQRRSERNIYLDLLKMQENVVTSEYSKYRDSIAKEKPRNETHVLQTTEKEVSKIQEERKTTSPELVKKLTKIVPQCDQPLKKRYKRFFIDNIK